MKKIKIFSLFVCLAMLVIACHNDDDERGVQMRTVLVYIAILFAALPQRIWRK